MNNKAIRLLYLLAGVFAAGFALATIIMVFILPQSGRKTREQLTQRAKELWSRQQMLLKRFSRRGESEREEKERGQNWIQKLVA